MHPASPATIEITLSGLAYHVCVGILPHERELPQPLEIDVVVRCPAGDVLDYRQVHDAVSSVVEAGGLDFLETIAMAVANRVMALPRVTSCRVAARKPHVMLGTPLSFAQVAVEQGVA